MLTYIAVLSIAQSDNSLTAPYSFTISSPTNTSLKVAWSDSNDVDADSVAVMQLSGSDSLHLAYVGISSTNTTIASLTPHTLYTMYVKILRGDSCKVSNLDTLYTAWPNLETANMANSNFTQMYGARSWLASNATWDTLYVYDSTGLDSTFVYRCSEKMAMQVKAIAPHADSAYCNFYIFYGNMNPSNVKNYTTSSGGNDDTASYWGFNSTASDTLAVSANGWSKTLDLLPSDNYAVPVPHFYIRADGQSKNGKYSKYIIKLFRFGARP